MNKKDNLLLYLSVLKQKRQELVGDFLNESVEIYQPMIRYRKSKSLTEISTERYFLLWISNHYNEFMKQSEAYGKHKEKIRIEFNGIYLSLVEDFKETIHTSELMEHLLTSKILSLKEMMKSGENFERSSNKLRYAMEKEDMMFEKLIIQTKKENG